ncbi:MAG TPA: hypothetical protein VHX38_12850 [Pseudonocardiaceae bacterium]|jgi:hypothetical protein|nr:hypothetical protein [Pseudonocardiaceae bacterium]
MSSGLRAEVEAGFALAKPVADAVLYEGYLLYPYRSSSTKNQVRWQFGVLMPPVFVATDTGERDRMFVDCLAEPGPTSVLHIRVRFLQLQLRQVYSTEGPVGSLLVRGTELTSWQEAVEQEVDVSVAVSDLLEGGERAVPIGVPAGADTEELTDTDGTPLGRLVRQRWAVSAAVHLSAEPLPGPYGGVRLRLAVHNTSPVEDTDRDKALQTALIACHAVVVLRDGAFISLREPPEWAKPAVRTCTQEGAWPIMLGSEDQRDMLLVSPIILDDYPSIAPESPQNLFDGTEIDEILTLRTLALTEDEKREARATDPRAKEIIDHVDSMPAELWDRLHGTVRYLRAVTGEVDAVPEFGELTEDGDPIEPKITERPGVPWWNPAADSSVDPETDSVSVNGVTVAKGSRVILRPGLRRADAQDMFLAGRAAIVQSVIFDVDGDKHIAVTLENDPAAELESLQGRFRYFAPEEIEPLGSNT